MILLRAFYFFALSLVLSNSSFAQELESNANGNPIALVTTDTATFGASEVKVVLKDSLIPKKETDVYLHIKDSVVYPPARKDWRRLGYTSSMYLGTTVIAFGVLWLMPESATNWDKEEIKEKGILWKWKENVKAGPVWDEDDWVLNWITHPYSGGIYYMTSRSAGFSRLESFGYSAIMSTFFWEYGIEAFAEIPSIQDLIITPVVGSVVGEGFFLAKKSILRHDKKVFNSRFLGITTLFLMDPFNTILDGLNYKEKFKTQMNVAPVGVNQFSKSPVWGVQFSAQF